MVSIDVKCAVTTAILSVLIYLLLVNILTGVWGQNTGKAMNGEGVAWFQSMEVVMLVGVFVASNVNNYLFNSCKSA